MIKSGREKRKSRSDFSLRLFQRSSDRPYSLVSVWEMSPNFFESFSVYSHTRMKIEKSFYLSIIFLRLSQNGCLGSCEGLPETSGTCLAGTGGAGGRCVSCQMAEAFVISIWIFSAFDKHSPAFTISGFSDDQRAPTFFFGLYLNNDAIKNCRLSRRVVSCYRRLGFTHKKNKTAERLFARVRLTILTRSPVLGDLPAVKFIQRVAPVGFCGLPGTVEAGAIAVNPLRL